jgi:tRNA-dihydrouridine synthase
VPVLANGGVEAGVDLGPCLAATGCDGVMVAEVLSNTQYHQNILPHIMYV